MELDGRPWRSLPVAAVAVAGLYEGCDLDRERARRLARARRRAEAVEVAARALQRRALSEHEVDERLARRSFGMRVRRDAHDALASAGHLDDAKVASGRAEWLADRGSGDALIRDDLERRGIALEHIERALEDVEPEQARAERVVQQRGRGPRTARWLAARGFDAEAIEQALGTDVAPDADDVVG